MLMQLFMSVKHVLPFHYLINEFACSNGMVSVWQVTHVYSPFPFPFSFSHLDHIFVAFYRKNVPASFKGMFYLKQRKID